MTHQPTQRARESGETWFCERGDFWGTYRQLCLCAKCGKYEHKRHDEPRHVRGIFKPWMHMLCDECFDSLPDDAALIRKEAEGIEPPPAKC